MALKRPEVLDILEKLASVETHRYSLDQVVSFVKQLRAGTPATDIASSTNLSEEDIIDLGAKLGTWLTHVFGSVNAEIVIAAKQEQPALFTESKGKKVIIPVGFERRGKQRREITRALATVIRHNPDKETLSRFLDRLYPSKNSVLTARDVFMVWRFAQLGRLAGLAEISPNHPAFCQTMVSAYNLFETSIQDADQAIKTLTDITASADELAAACVKVGWLHQARIERFERLVTSAAKGDYTHLLRQHQERLALEVSTSPRAWKITDISQLIEGQVLRLVQAAGLVNEESSRREALEIRAHLIELDAEYGSDLAKDLDLLVPEGLRAKRAGLEVEYWEAVDARINGDPTWRSQLETAFAGKR